MLTPRSSAQQAIVRIKGNNSGQAQSEDGTSTDSDTALSSSLPSTTALASGLSNPRWTNQEATYAAVWRKAQWDARSSTTFFEGKAWSTSLAAEFSVW